MWGEVASIKLGLDSSIQAVKAEVWHEHSEVHEGQCQACWDAAKKDWAQGRTPALWRGSNRKQGFSLVRVVVAWVRADNDQWRAEVACWLFGSLIDIFGEDGLHAVGNVVEG